MASERITIEPVEIVSALAVIQADYSAETVIGEDYYDTAQWTGFVARFNVLSVATAPTITVKVQSSVVNPDTVSYSPWKDLKTFASITAAGFTDLTLPDGTIYEWPRWIRFVMSISGGGSSASIGDLVVSPKG